MITIQPIRFTAHTEEWHRFAHVLGLTPPFPPDAGWAEFDGNGILAIHHAGEKESGRTELNILVEDVEAMEAALTSAGIDVDRRMTDDIGPIVTITVESGAELTFSGGPRTATTGPLSVQPIWYQANLEEPRRILEALGLQPRIASDSGAWIDFTADGGGTAALHQKDAVALDLSFEYTGDLDALAVALGSAGYEASVCDEAYDRTLHVVSPDGDTLWINGTQTDLYGYARLG